MPTFPKPVTHEFGAYYMVSDLNLYFSFVNYFMENVPKGKRGKLHVGERTFELWSSASGFINPRTKQRAFEYHLAWKDSVGASKIDYRISPRFGSKAKTTKGQPVKIKYVGTAIQVQTSYLSQDNNLDILNKLFEAIDASRFKDSFDLSNSYIYQMARHIRYHQQHEPDMYSMLAVLEYESDMSGDVKVIKNREAGQINMFKLSNPNWSAAKIYPEWIHDVKTYRINNFLERVDSDPLKHPKLEVFLPGKTSVPAKRYLQIARDLDKTIFALLHNLVRKAGPMEYIPDDYFNPDKTVDFKDRLSKWEWTKTRDFNGPGVLKEVRDNDPLGALNVLAYLSLQKEGCAAFSDILEDLEISKSTLWRYISSLREKGILNTKRGTYTWVFFAKTGLWDSLKEPLLNLAISGLFKIKKIHGDYFVDSGMIRRYRERAKNLKPIKKTGYIPEFEKVVVESFQEASKLNKEFKELGIPKRASVLSTHHTLRYSRVR